MHRGIGTAGMAAAIINNVVGAGIFTLPAALALQAGADSIWAYVLCSIAMAAVVICFADAGARLPTSGGVYGTVQAAFGPGAGFVTAILLIVSDLFGAGGIAAALAAMAGHAAPLLSGPVGHAAFIAAALGSVAVLNLTGVQTTSRLVSVATLVKLLPLALFLAVCLYGTVVAPPPPVQGLGPGQPGGIARATVLALFAFCGLETPISASGELRDPAKSLPRALFFSMGFVLVLYLCIQAGASALLGAHLAHSPAPLADAAGRVSGAAQAVLLGGGALSMFVWLLTDMLGSSRMIFALARDGRAPAFLGVLHPRSRVPARAVLVYGVAVAALAMSGSFLTLIVASALNSAALYALGAAASLVLHRQGVAVAGRGIRVPGLPMIAVFAIVAMGAVIAAAQFVEIAGLAMTIVLACGLYFLTPRRARIGEDKF